MIKNFCCCTPVYGDFNFPADGQLGEPVWSVVNICVHNPAANLIGSEFKSEFSTVNFGPDKSENRVKMASHYIKSGKLKYFVLGVHDYTDF